MSTGLVIGSDSMVLVVKLNSGLTAVDVSESGGNAFKAFPLGLGVGTSLYSPLLF